MQINVVPIFEMVKRRMPRLRLRYTDTLYLKK